jgi:thiol-disulfide isomerase/thioredoxin
MSLPILYNIENKTAFAQLLQNNPGVVIIKFGAKWCAPCKRIETQVQTYMNEMPDYMQCVMVDIDESIEIYGFLKTKKMLNGIPAILAYYVGNTNYIPDDAVICADPMQITLFFKRCLEYGLSQGLSQGL